VGMVRFAVVVAGFCAFDALTTGMGFSLSFQRTLESPLANLATVSLIAITIFALWLWAFRTGHADRSRLRSPSLSQQPWLSPIRRSVRRLVERSGVRAATPPAGAGIPLAANERGRLCSCWHTESWPSTITSRVGMGPTGHSGFGLTLALDLQAPQLERGEELMARAHERCPYSNATRGNVDVTLSVDGKRLEPSAA